MTFFDIPSGRGPAPEFEGDTKSHLDADEWEDEQVVTPIEDSEQLIAQNATKHTKKSLADRIHSVHRPKRLKSRGRQRAQNARAGIKLITDFSGLRKPGQQQQQKNSPNMGNKSKFVDLAALRALEGSPNSASTGSWNWLKRQKSAASPNHLAPSPADVGLSPADRPIMIGISMDEGALAGKEISPHTAGVENPPQLPRIQTNGVSPNSTAKSTTPVTPSQLRSVWSPDTPASASTIDLESRRATSSIYSQATGASAAVSDRAGVPPVPEVPAGFKTGSAFKAPMSALSEEEVDTGTPCTLFEEDATPTSAKVRRRQRLASRNFNQSIISEPITEWWDEDDEVQTPAAAMAPAPLRLLGTQTSTEAPVVHQSHAHQVNITNITIAAPTMVSISRPETERLSGSTPTIGVTASPRPVLQLSQERTGIQGSFSTESRNGPHVGAARTHSTLSDAVTEIWNGEPQPANQAITATSSSQPGADLIGIAISPSSPVASPAYTQRRHEESMRSEQTEPQSPPRSESHAHIPWTSSRQGPALTRTESPTRTASPARRQSPGGTASPAWSQSQGQNQSPARSTPRLALGAATMSSSARSSPRRAETRTGQAGVVAEEIVGAGEEPPPYSPPRRNLQILPRFRAVFPPDHPLHGRFPPSPGPVSPGMSRTMTSQGAVDMTEIPLTPGPVAADSRDGRARGFVPAEHYGAVESRQDRVERRRLEEEREQNEKERKRLEKERKREEGGGGVLGLLMKLRNLIPRNQSTAAAAAPAAAPVAVPPSQSKPIWPWVTAGAIALIILAGVLAGVLTRKGDSDSDSGSGGKDDSFFDFPGFPPMPTGVLTVVGPENARSEDRCTRPSTLWSCELPPELHDSVAPHKPSQPTVIMHIQVDNTSQASWDVPNGDPPVPKPGSEGTDDDNSARLRRSSTLGRRLSKRLATGISPDPAPPAFEEMFFLGDTSDGIVSDNKAGEPTPFYISLLGSTSDSAGPDLIQKRSSALRPRQFSKVLPDPELAEDGTGAPARLLPQAKQQPVRLYDRGLPTEHYGFYTYFRRTIYLSSVSANDTGAPADQDGGSLKEDAKFVVTWSETRFLVKLWTGKSSKELLKGEEGRPGTMPYPVTMQLDTHGGDAKSKFVWAWAVEDGKIDDEEPRFLVNDIGAGGEVANPRSDENGSFGGVDGGVGGCGCEWVNFVEK